jgi:hypothetical protein
VQGQSNVTELLRRWTGGDRAALDELMPLVYNELHRLAYRYLGSERSDHTLQGNRFGERGLSAPHQPAQYRVAEPRTFLRRGGSDPGRMLVDHARERNAAKRKGGRNAVPLDEALTVPVQCRHLVL